MEYDEMRWIGWHGGGKRKIACDGMSMYWIRRDEIRQAEHLF